MKKEVLIIGLLFLSVIGAFSQELTTQRTTNWNTLKKSGFFESMKNENVLNSPDENTDCFWGINIGYTINSTEQNPYFNGQIAFPVNYSSTIPPKMYIRSTSRDGEGIWAKVLHDQGDQVLYGSLHTAFTNGGSIRLGKIGDPGNIQVTIGEITSQYNIDFTGYRNIAKDQIGARISAIRFNNYLDNTAYVQNTGLAFYTNPSGRLSGTQELLERMRITPEGNMGIGTTNPQGKLDVNGTIRAKEVKIEATGWSDFVFAKDYKLPALQAVEQHIYEKQHLPDMPSEKQVLEEGVNVVEMQAKLLQKIEELTLYVIEQDKQIDQLKQKNKEMEDLLKTVVD